MKRNKPRQNIIKAFNAAIEGVIYTFKHERNMKIHYVIAVVVLLISLFLNLSRVEMMILLLSISLVIVSEMFNTAVENAVDLTTNEIHPLAKIGSACNFNMHSISFNFCSCSKGAYSYGYTASRWNAKWSCGTCICTCNIYNNDYRKSNCSSFRIYNGCVSSTKPYRR